MKRNIAVLLLIYLLTLQSCQDSSSPPPDNTHTNADTTEGILTTHLDELGVRDFGGQVFTVLDSNSTPSVHVNVPSEEAAGETVNDGIFFRDSYISERYNAKIKYEQITSGGATIFKNSILAGERSFDMIISTINNSIGALATEGLLANLTDYDVLSLDRQWWSPLIYDSCRIKDIMYYTAGDIAPAIYCAPGCIYVNNKLAGDYNIPIDVLYDKVENGDWTLDYVYSFTKDMTLDLNEDANITVDEDFFGILNEPNTLTANVFVSGAGINLSGIDSNGSLYTGITSENTLSVIEKLTQLLSNATYKDATTSFHSAFTNDRALFFMHYVSSAYTRYRDMASDFSILPIPKFDSNQSTYRSLVNTWCNSFVAIPVNLDSDYAPFLMEAMAWYSHENLRPLVYDGAFKNKGARNERDSDMLDIIFDTLYLDFNSFSNFGNSLTVLQSAIFSGGNFASGYASVSENVAKAMDDFESAWINKK